MGVLKKSFLDRICDPQRKLKWGKSIKVKNNSGGIEIFHESDLPEDWFGEKIYCSLCENEIISMYEYYVYHNWFTRGFECCEKCVLGCEDKI